MDFLVVVNMTNVILWDLRFSRCWKISMLAFWAVTSYGLVSGYHFRGTYCNPTLKMEAVNYSKMLVPAYKFTWPHNP
jgi:hypothetical protein